MARNLYEILGLSPGASPALVSQAYEDAKAKLEAKAAGDADARNELTAVKEAYRTLSSPERRATYDAMLMASASTAQARAHTASYDGRSWLDSLRPGWVLGALVMVALAYAGQKYYAVHMDSKTRASAIDNDGLQVRGTIQNQADSIANGARIQNRSLDIAESAEARQGRALDYQRQEQERRSAAEWSRQQFAERERTDAARTQADRAEAARVEKQRRYEACVASAIGTTGSLDKARQRCMSYM